MFEGMNESLLKMNYFFSDVWANLTQSLPSVLFALIIIIVGYFVGLIIGIIIKKVLIRIGLDSFMRSSKLDHAIGYSSLSKIVGKIAKWYVVVFSLQIAARIAYLGSATDYLVSFALWAPHLILAMVIFIFGLIFSDFVAQKLSTAKTEGIRLAGKVLRAIILIVIGLTALDEIGIKVQLVQQTWLIVFGAICLAFALAFGIGFGLGMKDKGKAIMNKLYAIMTKK